MRNFLIGLLLLPFGIAHAGCTLEKVATLPTRIDNGRVFVPGTMDGHPVEYLVDLASRTLLLRIAAQDFGVRPDFLGSLDKIATFGEPGPDQLIIEHLPLSLGGASTNLGTPRQVAVLGTDFFNWYDVEFDVQHGKIVLYKPAGCETVKMAYWPGPVTVAEMISNNVQINSPPFNSYNLPHLNIRLSVGGKDMVAAIDTGYRRSSLSLAAAHSLGLTEGGPGTAETGRTVDLLDGFSTPTWTGTVGSVALGDEVITPARIDFRTFMIPAGAAEPHIGTNRRPSRYHGDDMMLGADFLIAHRIFLSQSQKKVYFSPAENVSFLKDGATPAADRPAY